MPRNYTRIPPEERFWSHVDRSGECWLWTAGTNTGGYGLLATDSRHHVTAHRFSYSLAHGSIPAGLSILHHCDVRTCVRPDHLYAGTPADNSRDRRVRGRAPRGDDHPLRLHPELAARGEQHGSRLHPERLARGEKHGSARLTVDQVLDIRALYAAGAASQYELAARYGVDHTNIAHIVHRRSWRHV